MMWTTGKPQWIFIAGIAALTVAGAILFFSLPASADSAPPNPWGSWSMFYMMSMLSLNYVINLFLFTGFFLLFARIWRKKVGKLDPNRDRFMLKVLVGIAIVTFFGLFIDIAFVTPYSGFRLFHWAIALVLIFSSIYVVAHYMMKISRRVSLLIGIGMVAVNMVSWLTPFLLAGYMGSVHLLMLAVLPLLLIVLYKWHRAVFSAK